jgi:hypothetical protein
VFRVVVMCLGFHVQPCWVLSAKQLHTRLLVGAVARTNTNVVVAAIRLEGLVLWTWWALCSKQC